MLQIGCDPSFLESMVRLDLRLERIPWSSKFGLSVEDRRALGYHSGGKDLSVLTYSRDALSKPLRALQTVLDSIAQKTFFPDSTRSGYLGNAKGNNDAAEADEEDRDVAGDEEAIDEVAGNFQGNGRVPWTELSAVYFRHKASRCISMF